MPPRRPAAPIGPPSGDPSSGGGATSRPAAAARPKTQPKSQPKTQPKPRTTTPRATSSSTRTSRTTSARSTLRSAGRVAGVRDAEGRLRLVRPMYAVAGVLALLALLILPDLNRWLVQRSQISDVHAQNAQAQRDVTALQAEAGRWQDPEYVKAQARARLHYVMPGETGFVTVEPEQPSSATGDSPADAAARTVAAADRPWFGDLWESVQVAGRE